MNSCKYLSSQGSHAPCKHTLCHKSAAFSSCPFSYVFTRPLTNRADYNEDHKIDKNIADRAIILAKAVLSHIDLPSSLQKNTNAKKTTNQFFSQMYLANVLEGEVQAWAEQGWPWVMGLLRPPWSFLITGLKGMKMPQKGLIPASRGPSSLSSFRKAL